MPSIIEYLKTLPKLDPMQQGILVPARNFFPRYGDRFDEVFEGHKSRFIKRVDVFNAFIDGGDIGCKTAIAWGFPRGGRPGGRSLDPALDAIPHFLKLLSVILEERLLPSTYDAINSLPNVKNGITTKILYFSGACTASGAHALIYDSRVQDHLLTRNWDEYRSLTNTLKRSTLQPTAEQYLEFLEITQNVSRVTGWDSAAIEMFMFTDAPNKRTALHK